MGRLGPTFDPPGARAPRVVETHASMVFFVGDRVTKMKKPVRFGFLDFRTLDSRRAACAREVELNRRFCPDVYLGTATVLDEGGEPCEHLVVMRRLPEERRLAALLPTAEGPAAVDATVDTIVGFHDRAPTSPAIARGATRGATRKNWRRNLAELEPFAGDVLRRRTLAEVAALAERFLAGREPLFRQRIWAGKVRDCHGDLLAEDIFCLDDGVRVIDCIDFDDALRHIDVIDDLTFLAMDVERLGFGDLAERIVRRYRRRTGDRAPDVLVHVSIAYRALVRCKVACLRAAQGDGRARRQAGALLDLARRHLEHARVRLILVGGPPGTGKTTLARGIAGSRGFTVLRSDEVRAHRGGPPPAPFEGSYGPAETERVYRALLHHARELLQRGESVVLDATWSRRDLREEARALARVTATDLLEFRCDLSPDLADARIRSRRGDRSAATPAVAAVLRRTQDPWPEAIPIRTDRAPGAALGAVEGALDAAASTAAAS